MEFDQEVARVAYELYLKSGRIEGHDLENWLEAEKIVLSRRTNRWNEDLQSESGKVSTSVPEPASSASAESSGTAVPKSKKSARKSSPQNKQTRS